jgi:hypothetical protein
VRVRPPLAACLMLFAAQKQEDQRIVGDAISTDEQAVKPWLSASIWRR